MTNIKCLNVLFFLTFFPGDFVSLNGEELKVATEFYVKEGQIV